MSWTDERVEQLKKLWIEGLSASQIAARMGGITRNAVIGKVHRLGLSGRSRPSRPARTIARTPRQRPAAPSHPSRFKTAGATALKRQVDIETRPLPQVEAEPEPAPIRAVELPSGQRMSILTLTERTCKWPIGDPGDEEFHFCGHRSEASMPYCKSHARMAYQPAQDRRRRKKIGSGA